MNIKNDKFYPHLNEFWGLFIKSKVTFSEPLIKLNRHVSMINEYFE